MKHLLSIILTFVGAYHSFGQTVDLRDGSNTLLASYNSITLAYAAIPATLSQAYTIELTAGYTSASEVFPIILTAKTGASAANTITIRPAIGVSSVTISGTTGTNTALLKLDDADWIVVDGRPGGTGSTSALTINQQGTPSTSYGIWMINGATNNAFRWCNFNGYTSGSSGNKCIFIGPSASNPTGNSNNTFEFLKFTGARYYINSAGTDANNNNNLRVYGCEFVNTNFAGFWGQGGTGLTTVDSNFFYSTGSSGTSGTGIFAVLFDFLGDTAIITRNKIYDFNNSSFTTDVYGICVRSFDPYPSYTRITNNFIALNAANSTSDIVYGIEYGTNSANNPHIADIHFNTVRIGGTATGGTAGNVNSAAFAFDGTHAGSVFNISNNLFINDRSGGNEQHVGIVYVTSNSTINRSYNTYNVASGNIARIGTTLHNTMASYQTAVSPNEANSNDAAVQLVSATDLHLTGSSISNPSLSGSSVSGVTTDIDGDLRTTPYRGADEVAALLTCSGTPNAAVITGPAAVQCPDAPFTIIASGQSSGPGIYYYWQSRPAGSSSPWVTITGATTTTLNTFATQGTEYMFIDSCSGSTLTASSNVFTVNVAPPPAVASISETHTALQYSFTANGVQNATTYSWDFGDNTSTVSIIAPAHAYSLPGTYTVTLIVSDACSSDTATLVINAAGCGIAPISQDIFVSDSIVCTDDTALLHVIWAINDSASAPYFDVQWQESPDGLSWTPIPGAVNDSIYVTPVDTTYYRYSLTCAATSQTVISDAARIYFLPPPSISGIDVVNIGNNYSFTALDPVAVTTYSWTFGDGSPTVSGGPSQSHTYAADGSFVLTLVVLGECGSDTISANITVSTGIVATQGTLGVTWYPNPAQDRLTIRSTSARLLGLTVLNSFGSVVLSANADSEKEHTADLRALPPGSYFIRLQTSKGLLHLPFQKM